MDANEEVRVRPHERSATQHGVLLALWRVRLPVRRPGSDQGFTLIEMMAALLVFGIYMTGLTAGMIALQKTLVKTRVRSLAVNLAQEQIEKARALGYSNLALNDVGGLPTQAALTNDAAATQYPVVKLTGCSACITYQTITTSKGVAFTVKQYVLQGPTGTGDSGQPLVEKYLRVIVQWSSPSSGTVDMSTTFSNATPLSASPPQGIDVFADDVATGLPIGNTPDDPEVFDLTISDGAGNLVSTAMDEGTYTNRVIAPGTYTCTVSVDPTSLQSWLSSANGTDTYSQSCVITAGQVLSLHTSWSAGAGCQSSATKGSLVVTVVDQNGAPVSGAPVQPQNVTTGNKPGKVNTNSSGIATFNNNLPADDYYYSISGLSNYQDTGLLGPVCIYPGRTTTATVTLTPNPSGPTMIIKVAVQNKEASANFYTGKVTDSAGRARSQSISVFPTKTGTLTFDSMPTGTGYTVELCTMEQSGNCNRLYVWTNQNFSTNGHTYNLSYIDQPG